MVSRRQFQVVWSAIVLVTVSVVLSLAGVLAWRAQTIKLQHETRAREVEEDQRQDDFCQLVKIFIDPSQPPPTTDRGRQQAQHITDYYRRDCAGR